MNDDEAFIRSILANPGDDAPRLVYADWLEERGDERGTYLRHEACWAKSKVAAAESRLQELANVLDPVWVARVSRPPVGVCFPAAPTGSHAELPSIDEIHSFQHRRGITLPPEYCAFLLNGYGGRYWQVGFPRPRFPASDCHLQHWFSIMCSRLGDGSLQLDKQLDDMQSNVGRRLKALVPICAASVDYHELITIGVGSHNAGKVYFVDEPNRTPNDTSMIKTAETLGRFLEMLYPIVPDSKYPD